MSSSRAASFVFVGVVVALFANGAAVAQNFDKILPVAVGGALGIAAGLCSLVAAVHNGHAAAEKELLSPTWQVAGFGCGALTLAGGAVLMAIPDLKDARWPIGAVAVGLGALGVGLTILGRIRGEPSRLSLVPIVGTDRSGAAFAGLGIRIVD